MNVEIEDGNPEININFEKSLESLKIVISMVGSGYLIEKIFGYFRLGMGLFGALIGLFLFFLAIFYSGKGSIFGIKSLLKKEDELLKTLGVLLLNLLIFSFCVWRLIDFQ